MIDKNENKCARCPGGFGLKYQLYNDDLFWIVCDAHPLARGHILVIPKEHIAAMGALADDVFARYVELYKKVKLFLEDCYGPVGIFEHGVAGQTVFHAYVHFLPFVGDTEKIITDKTALRQITRLEDVRTEFIKKGKYLFFENKNQMWLVDAKLGYPRFFRDIFAGLLNAKERADWKKAEDSEGLMKEFQKDILVLTKKWNEHWK